MSTSQFCIQQRLQEKQKLQRFLWLGFAGSALLHGIIAYAFPSWSIESSTKTEKPINLIIVDKPKPKSEPVKAVTPPPPVKPRTTPPKPEPVKKTVTPPPPVKPQTTPPKETPQKILTNPTPAPSPSVVSVPIQNIARSTSLNNSFNNSGSSVSPSADSGSGSSNPGVPGTVAVGSSAPPRPENNSRKGITCVSNCQPEYPATLEGVEGNAQFKLTIDSKGNVTSATLVTANSNSQINHQALLAARKMKFSSPSSNSSASVRVKIDFTVAGSEYDRAARQEQRERARAEQKRREQEAARQRQLEQERQARQEQLEREREARARIEQQQREQAEAEQKRQRELQRQPLPNTQTSPKPSLTPLETEVDDEMLRKFRERIQQHQQE